LGKGELGELIDQGEGFQGQRHRLGGRGLGATQNRQIRVPNFWVAIDQGIAVQPDNIIAQTESSVVCGLGLSPKERISIKNGEVQESNFYGYTVMRNRDVPEIHVEVVATTITRQAWDCSPGCTLRITGVPTGRDAPTKTHQRARCGLAFNGSARSASSR
jgi:Molybdopterin-binding domain of aldehyde dehydrogenase